MFTRSYSIELINCFHMPYYPQVKINANFVFIFLHLTKSLPKKIMYLKALYLTYSMTFKIFLLYVCFKNMNIMTVILANCLRYSIFFSSFTEVNVQWSKPRRDQRKRLYKKTTFSTKVINTQKYYFEDNQFICFLDFLFYNFFV